jgi:hypothetical protein
MYDFLGWRQTDHFMLYSVITLNYRKPTMIMNRAFVVICHVMIRSFMIEETRAIDPAAPDSSVHTGGTSSRSTKLGGLSSLYHIIVIVKVQGPDVVLLLCPAAKGYVMGASRIVAVRPKS